MQVKCFCLAAGMLWAAAMGAQGLEGLSQQLKKAPPELEQALRSRVAAFYQCFVDQEYRKAESFMVEESKDIFYKMDKPKYEGYRIEKVEFDDKFQEANVFVALDYILVNSRLGRLNVVLPANGNWVWEDNVWKFRYKKVASRPSPFGGEMHPGAYPEAGEAFQRRREVSIEELNSMVKLSKREFLLSGDGPSEDEVEIKNGMPNDIELDLAVGEVGDTVISLDKKVLKSGEVAKLRAKCDPTVKGSRSPLTFLFEVKPSGIRYAMKVTYQSSIPNPAASSKPN
jgi:hypothetical protein